MEDRFGRRFEQITNEIWIQKIGFYSYPLDSFSVRTAGQPETALKQQLTSYFMSEPGVSSAFLLRVTFGTSVELHVALCTYGETMNQDSVQQGVAQIFRQTFATGQGLDIIFLKPDQEQQVLKIGKPFCTRIVKSI